MSFFLQLHRSIVDPSFYRDVLDFSGIKVAGFFFRLIFFAALLCGIANTYYLLDQDKGLPARLEALFPGMEIKDGNLIPNQPVPYSPPSYLIAPVLDLLLSSSHFFDSMPESFIIVDTSASPVLPKSQIPSVLMSSKALVLQPHTPSALRLPYKWLLGKSTYFIFTAKAIRSFLLKNLLSLLFNACIWAAMTELSMLIFSVFFLSFAAYIFRIDRTLGFGKYFKMACFVVAPIAVGSCLVAISGVKLPWTWHVLLFIATIGMFRAVLAVSSLTKVDNEL